MFRFKTTNGHARWWKNRKIDWEKDYLSTWTHPHRALIVQALKTFPWVSLWEVGCGAGANLVRIIQELKPGPNNFKQLGGSDINPDAIAAAEKALTGARLHVEPLDDILLSDGATDVVLSDAALIYIGPGRIKKAVAEMVRISRKAVVLCEFHGGTPLSRWWLRVRNGYNAYDYVKLLEDAGCYDIQVVKMPKWAWDGFPWQPWGHVILAKVAKK